MSTLILVATMTGTAEMVGEDIVAALGMQSVKMVVAERATIEELVQAKTLLVVSSTYGEGEVPEPAKPLFSAIKKTERLPSDLQFAVVGLGDQSLYPDTFANGGRLWDALLHGKGLQRVCSPLLIDCSSVEDISSECLLWVTPWLKPEEQVAADGVH